VLGANRTTPSNQRRQSAVIFGPDSFNRKDDMGRKKKGAFRSEHLSDSDRNRLKDRGGRMV